MTGRLALWIVGIALLALGVAHAARFFVDAACGVWNGGALAWSVNYVAGGIACAIVADRGW